MADLDAHSDLIRRYLLGQLSEPERADFQARLLFDANLRSDLQVMRTAMKVLSAKQAPPPAGNFPRWALWAILLLIGSAAGYFYFAREKNTPPPPSENNAPSPGGNNNPVPPATHSPDTAPLNTPSKPSRPIAADFRPNPALERYRSGDSSLRGNGFSLKLDLPKDKASFQPTGGNLPFRVAGWVITSADKASLPPLRAHVFSNVPAEYAAFKPRWSADLSLADSPDGKDFRFEQKARLNLPDGQYYLLVENAESGAVLAVHAFQIIGK